MKIPFLSLLKKPLDSVSDEITTKFKTPFFTTYVFVWVIRNNIFVYNLIFNDLIKDKTPLLKAKFSFDKDFCLQTFYTLIIALLVILIYYIFVNFSRIITILSEERFKLNMLNKLKSKSISSVDDVNFWKNKSEELTKTNRILEEDIARFRSTITYNEDMIERLNKKYNELNKGRNNAINEINNHINSYYKEDKNIENSGAVIKLIESEINKLKKIGELPSFIVG